MRLLINADDFGLHPLIDEAIIRCAEQEVLNSISVMTNADFVDYKILKALQTKGIFIGVHLSWLRSKWLTTNYDIFSWKEFGQKLFLGGKKFKNELEKEAKAQIKLFTENGIQPDHIDSHQHVHHFPGVWKIIDKLRIEYSIQRIRCCKVADASLKKNGLTGKVLDRFASMNFNSAYHFYTTGLRFAGNYSIESMESELVKSSKVNTEFIIHPATKTEEMSKLLPDWHFDWEMEYNALLNVRLREIILKNNFDLIKRRVVN